VNTRGHVFAECCIVPVAIDKAASTAKNEFIHRPCTSAYLAKPPSQEDHLQQRLRRLHIVPDTLSSSIRCTPAG